ncbi:uncharacterized protein LOC130810313 [Amaranthus tricolor]|uniref:uncharacterized protein LOC130810313 n=1 Tax=Amaranthus tricolor TaxID=29722 RepID=UPI00258A1146|nr:uncharacterized protein LOC130810313 [Amaranthus tricolor]XP_057532306.1 uncharacterized protein LOC130810313 [Amaranthus tricolor]
MVDQETVCCMCGDIGFADKLFQCSSCRFRFQHSYCSSYNYGNHDFSSSSSSMMKSMEICDWCKSEGRNNSSSTNTTKSYKRSSSMDHNHHHHSITNSTSQGDQRIKRHQLQDHHIITNNTNNTVSGSSSRNHSNKNNSSGIPSPRPNAHRRYKLLKDVMC